jgi:hypothetical protein
MSPRDSIFTFLLGSDFHRHLSPADRQSLLQKTMHDARVMSTFVWRFLIPFVVYAFLLLQVNAAANLSSNPLSPLKFGLLWLSGFVPLLLLYLFTMRPRLMQCFRAAVQEMGIPMCPNCGYVIQSPRGDCSINEDDGVASSPVHSEKRLQGPVCPECGAPAPTSMIRP